MKWNIQIHDPSNQDFKEFECDKAEISVGRADTNDLILTEVTTSRNHMKLGYDSKANHSWVEDLASTNGTFLKAGDRWQKVEGRLKFNPPALISLGHKVSLLVTNQQPATEQHDVFYSQLEDISAMENREAIMVTDMVGATDISDKDNTMGLHLKGRLASISRFVLFSNTVSFYKDTGDGFLATFDKSADALMSAREILNLLKARNTRTKNPPIHVRIGLHVGLTLATRDPEENRKGKNVDMTFRVEGVKTAAFLEKEKAPPEMDRILCTEDFYKDVAGQSAALKALFQPCGPATLKGIEKPVQIYYSGV